MSFLAFTKGKWTYEKSSRERTKSDSRCSRSRWRTLNIASDEIGVSEERFERSPCNRLLHLQNCLVYNVKIHFFSLERDFREYRERKENFRDLRGVPVSDKRHKRTRFVEITLEITVDHNMLRVKFSNKKNIPCSPQLRNERINTLY